MSKIIYDSAPLRFSWRHVNPWAIIVDLLKYRELIASMTLQNFRSTYQASYLGIAWQVILPLIMMSIFYFVFGMILGGRFMQTAIESPLDYALALFVGLAFFNFISQNIGSSPSLIMSHQVYVKNLSFPLEIISIVSVLTSMLTLIINLMLAVIILILANKIPHVSAVLTIFYVLCVFIMTVGISWILSGAAVFFRDISAIVSPLTIILMFMCPIFYPASMVPKKIKWIIEVNPVAVIIENARGSLLYGASPTFASTLYVFLVSLFIGILGYFLFMRSKDIFADVL